MPENDVQLYENIPIVYRDGKPVVPRIIVNPDGSRMVMLEVRPGDVIDSPFDLDLPDFEDVEP
jgi:hypothetical protein